MKRCAATESKVALAKEPDFHFDSESDNMEGLMQSGATKSKAKMD